MGCNCGRRKGGASASLQRSRTIRLEDGVYQTSGTNCTTAYQGEHTNRSVIVVAAGTPDEQWFTLTDRTQAVQVAAANGWTFDQLPSTAVCHDTVVQLFGS